MTVWFCSDLHFGHKNIGKFREPCGINSEKHNRERIMEDWCSVLDKRGIVYVLGDACFTIETLEDFGKLPGRKILIRGNHDRLDTRYYLKYFESVEGLLKYKEFWLSHAPVHPHELRGRVNLHGHVHFNTVRYEYDDFDIDPPGEDYRYFNCCPEVLWPAYKRSLISIDEVRKELIERSNI